MSKRLTRGQRSQDAIVAALRDRGAPDHCYVFSEDDDLDRQYVPLTKGIEGVMSASTGSFVSCVPGRLAYYENEHGERWILDASARVAPRA